LLQVVSISLGVCLGYFAFFKRLLDLGPVKETAT
jgi:hypothetical protein